MLEESKEYFALSAELRDYERKYKEFVEPKKKRWNELRTILFQKLKESGQASTKFRDLGTLSIAIERKPVVANERAVIGWLKQKGLTDYYSTEPHLTDMFYESVLPTIKAGTVEAPIGIEFQVRETLKTLADKSSPETETKDSELTNAA